MQSTEQPLHSISLNPQNEATILLLHGSCASAHEYIAASKSKHLQPFHLLIPSFFTIPDTTGTLTLRSFDLEKTAAQLASLVAHKAPNRRVHVVGVSLGAHIAIRFTSTYPSLTASLFASGLQDWPLRLDTAWKRALAPWGLKFDMGVGSALPDFMIARLLDGWTPDAETRKVAGVTTGLETCREVAEALALSCRMGLEGMEGVACRSCIIVAVKGSAMMPTYDSFEAAMMWKGWIEGKDERAGNVRLAKAMGCRHAWHIITPEPFAEAVASWVNEGELGGVLVEVEHKQ